MTVSKAGRDLPTHLQSVCMHPGHRPLRQRWWESPPFRVRLHLIFFIAQFFFFFHFWLCRMVCGVFVLPLEVESTLPANHWTTRDIPTAQFLKLQVTKTQIKLSKYEREFTALCNEKPRRLGVIGSGFLSYVIMSVCVSSSVGSAFLCVGFIVQQILPNGKKTAMNISTFPTRQLKL